MTSKEKIIKIFENMEFEEAVEIKRDCPKCGGKNTVLRRVAKESSQNMVKRWFVEYCNNTECDFWNCGFT